MFVCKEDLSEYQIWQYVKESVSPPEGFYIDFECVSDDILMMNQILIENNYGDTTKEMVWDYAREYEEEPDYERIFAHFVIADFIELCKENDIPYQTINDGYDYGLHSIVLIKNNGKWVEIGECDKEFFASQCKKHA